MTPSTHVLASCFEASGLRVAVRCAGMDSHLRGWESGRLRCQPLTNWPHALRMTGMSVQCEWLYKRLAMAPYTDWDPKRRLRRLGHLRPPRAYRARRWRCLP